MHAHMHLLEDKKIPEQFSLLRNYYDSQTVFVEKSADIQRLI